MSTLKNFFIDETGQGMVEYALIIAFIAAVVFIAVQTFGGSILASLENSGSEIDKVPNKY
ncbi:MAG: Flp family type IVb pilin [Eubacterium sp.]|nr:Flp family type IVb pilin [Eubacterium sp.]